MINKWGVSNFKSIIHAELDLAPLTIISGTPSSGKSSFLQSMLLTAQNLQDKSRTEAIHRETIAINGKFIELGNFTDVYSLLSEPDDITPKKIIIKYRLSHEKFVSLEDLNIIEVPDLWDFEMVHRNGLLPEWGVLETVSGGFSFGTVSNSWLTKEIERIHKENMNEQEMYPEHAIGISSYEIRKCLQTIQVPKLLETRLDAVLWDGKNRSDIFIQSKASPLPSAGDRSLDDAEYFYIGKTNIDANSLKQINNSEFHDTIKNPDRICMKTDVFLPNGLFYNENAYLDKWGGDPYSLLAAFDSEDNMNKNKGETRISKYELWSFCNGLHEIINLEEMLENALPGPEIPNGIQLSDWYKYCRSLPKEKQDLLKKRLSMMSAPWVYLLYYSLSLSPLKKDLSDPWQKYRHIDLPGELKTASECVNRYFTSSFKYIRPLREDARIHNQVPPTGDPSDIGSKGEYLEYVFYRNLNRYVKAIGPDYYDDNRSEMYEIKSRSLSDAVNSWVKYIGIAKRINVPHSLELGDSPQDFTMRVSVTGEYFSSNYLTNVGAGVSQVLPIIVACLMAGEGSTIVIEQPELHLHAKIQSKMADFFLAMALSGRQCIIETHSEHIVNRLRLRMAEAKDDSLCSLGKIYFAELDEGMTTFREVQINKYGSFSDWPDDFFDERTRATDDILFAAALKRERDEEDDD